jgi:hypothetical protein
MFANAIVTLLLALTCTSLSGWTLGHGGASAQSSGDGLGKAVEVATDFGALELVWSPDQRRIVGVVGERLVSYDVARGRIEWSKRYDQLSLRRIAFDEDGRSILAPALNWHPVKSTDMDVVLSMVDVRTGDVIRSIRTTLNSGGRTPRESFSAGENFGLSVDGSTVLANPGDSHLALAFNVSTGKELWRVGPTGPGLRRGFAMLDTAKRQAIFAGAGAIEAWDFGRNTRLSRFSAYDNGTLSRAILDPKSGTVFTGASTAGESSSGSSKSEKREGNVRAWNATTGSLVRSYAGPGGGVKSLNATADGKYLFAARARDIDARTDAYVVAWSIETGRMVAASSFGQVIAGGMALSPSRRQLAVSIGDSLRIIDLDSNLFR